MRGLDRSRASIGRPTKKQRIRGKQYYKSETYMSDYNMISLGAGVQSSTMALMAELGEITPRPNAAIFADTQAEPASVYRWLDWLEKQLSFPGSPQKARGNNG